jgi:hypothetical protein
METENKTAAVERPKPVKVKLVGKDGNAFAILGECYRAAKKAKWTTKQIEEFHEEATSGDYDDLLRTCMKWFDVH